MANVIRADLDGLFFKDLRVAEGHLVDGCLAQPVTLEIDFLDRELLDVGSRVEIAFKRGDVLVQQKFANGMEVPSQIMCADAEPVIYVTLAAWADEGNGFAKTALRGSSLRMEPVEEVRP